MNFFSSALVTVGLILIGSCGNKRENSSCFEYPKQIDSLNVRDIYDTARIYIYTWLCDNQIDNYYRAQFDLNYKSFFLRNDTIEIFFTSSLSKEVQKPNAYSDYTHYPSFAFNINSKEKLWGWDINGFSNGLNPEDSRFQSCNTPEVLEFVKTHKQILNPCFLELASKLNLVK